jgi:hypothetical protein
MKAAMRAIPVKVALDMIPEDQRKDAAKAIIQERMDSAVRLFGDPRIEAWELAEDLEWDVSDVYDAWDYDENAA